MDKDQNNQRPDIERPATEPLEERGIVTDLLVAGGGTALGNAASSGAAKLLNKAKKDK